MSPDIFMRPNSASPRATAWIVAAIVLVLNWAVPGQLQFDPIFPQRDSAPGVSVDARAQPGTLPRAQPSNATCEASVQKAPHSRWSVGVKLHALPPANPVVAAASVPSVVPSVRSAARLGITPRVFDARAPPAVTA